MTAGLIKFEIRQMICEAATQTSRRLPMQASFIVCQGGGKRFLKPQNQCDSTIHWLPCGMERRHVAYVKTEEPHERRCLLSQGYIQ